MTLIHELEPGKYQVRYKLPHHLPEHFKIEVVAGIPATYPCILTPSHTVTLKLSKSSNGAPSPHINVKLLTLEPSITIQTQRTNAEGEVTFNDVASRTYLIKI